LRFATPADAVAALNAAFGPKAESGWHFDRPLVLCPNAPGAPATLRTFRAPTTSTMHFGRVTIDLASGETLFVDEDHRDGNDLELKRVTLPSAWLEALRAILP
jgi:hypothetical protein